jgi:hypothetical protein
MEIEKRKFFVFYTLFEGDFSEHLLHKSHNHIPMLKPIFNASTL